VYLIHKTVQLDAMLQKIGLTVEGGTPLYRLVSSDRASDYFKKLCEAGILVRAFRDRPHWLRFGLPGDAGEWALLEKRLRTV
jgi:cobalamin biosynthetic protein CobC